MQREARHEVPLYITALGFQEIKASQKWIKNINERAQGDAFKLRTQTLL